MVAGIGTIEGEVRFRGLGKSRRKLKQVRDELGRYTSSGRKADRQTVALDKRLSQMGRSAGRTATQLRMVGEQMRKLRSSAFIAAGAITAVGVATFKTAAEFQQQVARTAAIADKGLVLEKTYRQVERSVLDLASSTEHTATEVAQGWGKAVTAGRSVQQIMAAQKGVADLATVAQIGFADAMDKTNIIMANFGLSADQTTRTMDTMTGISVMTNTTVSQLSDAVTNVGEAAKVAGVGFNEISAALGLMANKGLRGLKAGRGLQRMLISLQKPSRQSQRIMNFLGISADDARQGFDKLIGKLQTARRRLKPSEFSKAVFKIFDAFGGRAALALTSAGAENMRRLMRNLEKMDGVTKQIAEAQRATPMGQLKIIASQLNELVVTVGQYLFPVFEKAANGVRYLVEAFHKLGPETIAAAVNLLLFVGAAAVVVGVLATVGLGLAAVGFGFAVLAKAVVGITAIFWSWGVPLLLAIALAGTLYLVWANNVRGIQSVLTDLKNWVLDWVRKIADFMMLPPRALSSAFVAGLGFVKKSLLLFEQGYKKSIDGAMRFANMAARAMRMKPPFDDSDLKKNARELLAVRTELRHLPAEIKTMQADVEKGFTFDGLVDSWGNILSDMGDEAKTAGTNLGRDIADGLGIGFDELKGLLKEKGGVALEKIKELLGKGPAAEFLPKFDLEELQRKLEALQAEQAEIGTGMLPDFGRGRKSVDNFWELVKNINDKLNRINAEFPDLEGHVQTFRDNMEELQDAFKKNKKRTTKAGLDDRLRALDNAIFQLGDTFEANAAEFIAGARTQKEYNARTEAVAEHIKLLGFGAKKASVSLSEVQDRLDKIPWEDIPADMGASISEATSKGFGDFFGSFTDLGDMQLKGLGDAFGGFFEQALGGQMPAIGGVLGTAIGGAMSSPQIGAVIGKGIEGLFNTMLSAAQSMVQQFLDAVGSLVNAIGQAIPESRLSEAFTGAFDPMRLAIAGAAGVLVSFVVGWFPVLAAAAAILAVDLAMLGAVLVGITAMFLLLAGPIMGNLMILGVALGLFAGALTALTGFLLFFATQSVEDAAADAGLGPTPPGRRVGRDDENALPILDGQIVSTTNSFKKFQDSLSATADRLVAGMDHIFDSLLPVAGLFDQFASVLIEFGQGFFQMDAISEIVFDAMKNLLLVFSRLAIIVADTHNVLITFLQGAASVADFFKNLGSNIWLAVRSGFDAFLHSLKAAFFETLAAIALGVGESFGVDTVGVQMQLENLALASKASADASMAQTEDMQWFGGELSDAAAGLSTIDTDSMRQAHRDLQGMSMEEARIRAEQNAALKRVGEDLQSALTNIPQGFKVAAARFNAIDVGVPGTPGPNPISSPSTDGREGGNSVSNFVFNGITIEADSPSEFLNQLTAMQQKQAQTQTSSPYVSGFFGGD